MHSNVTKCDRRAALKILPQYRDMWLLSFNSGTSHRRSVARWNLLLRGAFGNRSQDSRNAEYPLRATTVAVSCFRGIWT